MCDRCDPGKSATCVGTYGKPTDATDTSTLYVLLQMHGIWERILGNGE